MRYAKLIETAQVWGAVMSPSSIPVCIVSCIASLALFADDAKPAAVEVATRSSASADALVNHPDYSYRAIRRVPQARSFLFPRCGWLATRTTTISRSSSTRSAGYCMHSGHRPLSRVASIITSPSRNRWTRDCRGPGLLCLPVRSAEHIQSSPQAGNSRCCRDPAAYFLPGTRKTFITSSPRWLMILTAMWCVAGFSNGRDSSL